MVVRPLAEPDQRVAQRPLGLGIDRAGGLVEDEQPRVGQLGPGQRDELALADRQALAPLADLGVEAVGQAGQPPVEAEAHERRARPRRPRRRPDPCGRSRGWSCRTGSRPGAPCARHRTATPGETSRRSTPSRRIAPAVGSARRHSSFENVVLPEPGLAHHRHRRPCRDHHVDAPQHPPAVPIGEVEALGPHLDRPGRQLHARVGLDDVERDVEHVEHLAPPGQRGLGLVEDLARARRWGRAAG